MTRLIRVTTVGALAAVAAGLAGCSGGGGGGPVEIVPTPPGPPNPALEDRFGVGFGPAFRAAANSDPRDPAASDLSAVSFTTDPIPIPL